MMLPMCAWGMVVGRSPLFHLYALPPYNPCIVSPPFILYRILLISLNHYSLRQETQKIMLDTGPDVGSSVWDALHSRSRGKLAMVGVL
jgi:hypothetical protein